MPMGVPIGGQFGTPGRAKGVPVPIPAPYAGINLRDGIAALQPNEARDLINWTADGNALIPRKGRQPTSTDGPSGSVPRLFAFRGATASKLIGTGGGEVWDFSSATASALTSASYGGDAWQAANYGNRLIGVQAGETPWTYDGSTVGATGFTGPTLTDLANIAAVRNRLWFCKSGSLDAEYGGLGAITGALTTFQISQVATRGGHLVAIGPHSQDGGDGPDDYTVFVTSEGEIIVYAGDPSATFSKVGNFMMPPPVGRNCLIQIGGQLSVLTEMGLVPISVAMSGVAFDYLALGNLGKVAPGMAEDVDAYGALDGWSMVLYRGLVIVNVPTLADAASKQWVFNTLKGAWTTWKHEKAAAWVVYGSDLYLSHWGEGVVSKYAGATDDGTAFTLTHRCPFITLGGAAGNLQATAVRFDIQIVGGASGRFGIDADYISRNIIAPSKTIASSIATTAWGSAWGSAWSTSNQYVGKWFSAYGEGRALALAGELTADTSELKWFGYQVQTQQGQGR